MLVPDLLYSPKNQLEDALTRVIPLEAVPEAVDAVTRVSKAQPDNTLDGVKGVVVRVESIEVINNKRTGSFWGAFGGDRDADIYPIVLVANGGSDIPIEFSLPHMFNGIRDGDHLPIAKPGITVQRNLDSLPLFLDIHILLMRSLSKQREFAKAMDAALESPEGKSIVGTLKTAITGVNAAAGVALNLSTSLLQLYLDFLGAEKDKQIFYGVGSLEQQPDALGIGRTHEFTDGKNARAIVKVEAVR